MKKYQPLLTIFLFLFAISFVSAATTLNTPAASSTVSGSVTFNVTTTDLADTGADLVNITFYGLSSSTANSSWSIIGQNNSVNLTVVLNQTVGVFSTTGLEDASDYTFNVTIINATGGGFIGEDTNTGITVDNTVPTAPSALSPTTDSDGDVTFSATVTGSETTACTIYFTSKIPGSTSSQAMTHSGNTCTTTINSIPEESYQYLVQATDGTNSTNSSATTLNVDIQSGSGGTTTFTTGTDSDGSNVGAIVIGIIVVLSLIAIFGKK